MSSPSSTDGGQPQSRSSTPATEVSPPQTPDFVLPPPSPETLRRRAQSDRASSEIGARMLKGWAMLSEECLRDDCWAIPLVRPPRARPGAQLDPRKECVICGTVYITSENGELVVQSTPAARANAAPSSSSQRRNETTAEPPVAVTEAIVRDVPREQPASIAPPALSSVPVPVPVPVNPLPPAPVAPFNPNYQQPSNPVSLAPAVTALQGALDSLTQRLTQVTLTSNMDVKQIKNTAEAMEAVMKSLHTAQQLSSSI